MLKNHTAPLDVVATPAEVAQRCAQIERLICAASRASRDHAEWKQAQRALRKAQDAALRDFGRRLGMRPRKILGSSFNWSIFSLRDNDYSKEWCEMCGGACLQVRNAPGHEYGFMFKNGLVIGRNPKLHALLVHTRHSFEKVAAFATDVRLEVECIGWSWHGPEYTAALLTRGAK